MRRRLGGALARVPWIAWACAAVALLNGVVWSLLQPPFQPPDEVAHVAYVQRIAETGRLPERLPNDFEMFSPEQTQLMLALRVVQVRGVLGNVPPLSAGQTAGVRKVEAAKLSRTPVDAGTASGNPPLYYLLGAAVYRISPSTTLLNRIFLLRLMSALMSALTALLVVLFVRELMPSAPWAWAAGGLAAAFQPTFGAISGAVNADSLLFVACAGALLATARILRRGLGRGDGVLLGTSCAVGVLTKPLFYGLVPGVALGLAIVLWRSRRELVATLRRAVPGAACFVAPVALWLLALHTFWQRPADHVKDVPVPGPAPAPPLHGLGTKLTFMWELFLPRLPGMTDHQPGYPLRDVWVREWTGHFGQLDYGFPQWVYDWSGRALLALGAIALVGLVARAWRARRAPSWGAPLLVCLVFAAGVAFAIGWSQWSAVQVSGPPFEQGRYLLPLLGLYAALVAVCVRALGRRWGPLLGAVIVVASIGLSVYAQMLTIVRYAT
ncbi:MAG TPA: DUF2142 domain-containing protein [Solirubrobacteraceae bacterium]|nr:DUF2142 domain-containing protein [Solirubrobacteraceae bacterium]